MLGVSLTDKPGVSKTRPPKRTTYQHGDLPNALSAAVLDLVSEKGIKGFSVIEAARRSGVSSGAPYRHFSTKEGLLAAVAAIVYKKLILEMRKARLKASTDGFAPVAEIVAAYVEFAIENRAAMEILFRGGLSHTEYPELSTLDTEAYGEYRQAIENLGLAEKPMNDLIFAEAALAHGFATLQLVGSGDYALTRDSTVDQAKHAARQLAHGFTA